MLFPFNQALKRGVGVRYVPKAGEPASKTLITKESGKIDQINLSSMKC